MNSFLLTRLRATGRTRPAPVAIALDRLDALTDLRDPQALIDLIASLRPARSDDIGYAERALDELIDTLAAQPARAVLLRQYLAALTVDRQHRYLYTDTGIVRPEGLRRGTFTRLAERGLPQAPHSSYLRDLFKQLFTRADDYRWVQGVARARWTRLWTLLWPSEGSDTASAEAAAASSADPKSFGAASEALADGVWRASARRFRNELGEAINILSTRLHAAATDYEVVRLHSDEPYDLDAFDHLSLRAAQHRTALEQADRFDPDDSNLAGTQSALSSAIADCESELVSWRKLLRRHGTTTALSQQVLAAGQMLARLRALAQITHPQPDLERFGRVLRLFQKLVEEQGHDSSVVDLWRRTNRMLALQVTEHAGLIGEHYVATTRPAWFGMMRAAIGAGVVVALMALIKQIIAAAGLPPLWNALAISINYAVGFVFVHLAHLAIATKQPAMTAALIASTVRSSPSGKRSLSRLASLIVAIVRTQFIAILFNVVAAIPAALALHAAMALLFGPDWLPADRAEHLLADVDPIHSLALPHAAIAGVCLYASGVLAGYYNNLTAVTQVPQRLALAGWLGWLGPQRRERFAHYLSDNLGALVGNASLGFMLGMAGFVGFLSGAPIDVRHVTLSASNFALGVAADGYVIDSHRIALLLVGILLIGIVNLSVSFTLALWTAFSANGLQVRDSPRLWKLVARKIRRRPWSLLIP